MATIDGYQFHWCVFLYTFLASFMLNFFFFKKIISAYYGTVSSSPSQTHILSMYTYIVHTDLFHPSRAQQRIPHNVCKPLFVLLVTKKTLN